MHEQQDQTEENARQAAVRKLASKPFFDPRVAFLAGSARASTTLVEFFDYNCPYCRASMPVVRKFYMAHRKDAKFAFIEFPIKGRESITAARAAIAARKQPDKYLDFHFRLMGEMDKVTDETVFADAQKSGIDMAKLKRDMQDPAVDKTISAAQNLAAAANVDGTPAFVINGRIREGGLTEQMLAHLLKGDKLQPVELSLSRRYRALTSGIDRRCAARSRKAIWRTRNSAPAAQPRAEPFLERITAHASCAGRTALRRCGCERQFRFRKGRR